MSLIRWFLGQLLRRSERKFDVDLGYARHMLGTSLRAFFRYMRFLPFALHRDGVPLEAWFAAKLTTTMAEDCGPCTQALVTMAEREGVSSNHLRAIIAADTSAMSHDVLLAYCFAKAVIAHAPEADPLREEIVERWGQQALISLSFAVASGRLDPTLKYALGYARSCQRVLVAGEPVPAHQGRSAPVAQTARSHRAHLAS